MDEQQACSDYENDRRNRMADNAADMFKLLEKLRRVRSENYEHMHFGIEVNYLMPEVERILKAVRG